jgi:uncharacterized membrane protein YeaQ/YmgE (transglycosylase-associated protein family)
MLHVVRIVIVGLIVGIIARFLYPGAVPLDLVMSTILGIAGSIVGGVIAHFVRPSEEPFHPAGFIMSVIGAMALIFVFRSVLHLV